MSNSRERLELPITVEVRDNGPGVAEDLVDHLFEPFISTKRRGSGLGLSLVAKIVADHRGVVSYLPGEPGATFRVRLPAAGRQQQPVPAAGGRHERREGPAGGGRRRDPHRGQPRAWRGRATTCRRPAWRGALWRWIAAGEGDVVITDVGLPDENSLDLLPRIRTLRPGSAGDRDERAEHAAHRGPGGRARRLRVSAQAVRHRQSGGRRAALAGQPRIARCSRPASTALAEEQLPIIGRSPAMQEIYRVIARLMNTDLTVLIAGESGTGKELVAQALHDFGKRKGGPFVAGQHGGDPARADRERAVRPREGRRSPAPMPRRVGRFEQAEGGTLFLDEIGDMPLEAQTRLLRVLQQGEFVPVGGHHPIRTNVRIVAASHRDLRLMVGQGLFREDLFYRLNVVPLRLPPLRERVDDIPALAQHFLVKAQADGLPLKTLTPEAMVRLKSHAWPGNVRELENLVRRLAVLYAEDTIGEDVITLELEQARAPTPATRRRSRSTTAWAAPSSATSTAISAPTTARCRRRASTTG